jgi:diguanylate cyclase (GGDEF)-like protein
MRSSPAAATSSTLDDFWRSYVSIGVLTYGLGAMAVVMYALAEPGPHRRAIVVLGCASFAASVGPFRWLGLHLVSTRQSKLFFTCWAGCTFVFIAVGAVLDGGSGSPISYFLIMPLLFAGLAFSPGSVSILTAVGITTTLVVGASTPNGQWSATAFLCLAMLIAGVITACAAYNRERLLHELMDAANLDALTGCLSRGAFSERLAHEAKRARRYRSSFSLIVADVDNLKTLNDSGGHHSGDFALQCLAAALRAVARDTDVVGRLGGDEFAMLLPMTDELAALVVASRLNEYLRASAGSTLVTASQGVSTWQGADDQPDELLRRADEALYAAKRAGRDRYALWQPFMGELDVAPAR